jgi:hypothetical protein
MGKIPDARNLLDSLSRNSDEKYIEDQINLDIYTEKYPDALMKATIAGDSDFDFKGIRSVYLAKICNLMHNNKKADTYYDSALVELNLALKADTGNAYIYGFIGVALAGRGNPDALTKGEKAVWIAKEKNDKILETEMILVQAEILTKLGLFDDASEKIKETLSTPSLFSKELLKIDPEWKPLLKNPKITALLLNKK